jgi:hypothetical protein
MTMHRINRSPDGVDGGGLPPSATPEAAGSQTPASAAPEYLSKADFESKWSELQGTLQKLTPAQREAREDAKDAKNGKAEGVKRPSPKDFDFEKDPTALERYEDAMDEYRYQTRKAKEAEEGKVKSEEERREKTFNGHKARVAEYRKENPTFDADAKKANLMSEPEATNSIVAHKESPAIIHHMAKNPALMDELNQLALTGDTAGLHQRVGEIAAEIRAERKTLEANTAAAADKPPRQNFTKGSAGAKRELTMEERYERNRS